VPAGSRPAQEPDEKILAFPLKFRSSTSVLYQKLSGRKPLAFMAAKPPFIKSRSDFIAGSKPLLAFAAGRFDPHSF
jgi:hypothetical protein